VPRATKPTVAAIALDRAAQACAGRGAKLTDVRRAVLSLIVENGKPLGAYALLDRLRTQKSNATPVTVYRALDFLLENGLIHKLERLNAFVACSDDGGHRSHEHSVQFLICRKCGTVAEMEDQTVARAISRAAGQTGFRPDSATIELEGTCARCSAVA
jgi:Fur family zinc uptake transcriptional regulator